MKAKAKVKGKASLKDLKPRRAAAVKGGRPARGESCKETGDTGMYGCPG